MIVSELPRTVDVCGRSHAVRWDMCAALDILCALADPDLTDREKVYITLSIFYVDGIPTDTTEAYRRAVWFLDGGTAPDGDAPHGPRVMDWEQDWPLIIAPVNRVLGYDVRGVSHETHWWTFLSAFQEIGDCTFAHVVRIRDHRARGKKLDKSDREFARRNARIVNLKTKYTQGEQELIASIVKASQQKEGGGADG